jgi:hypothetical protein|tara:strand:- start:22 stop:213 length:192 start_codon:yes stop_codon:yes gene_type:complete
MVAVVAVVKDYLQDQLVQVEQAVVELVEKDHQLMEVQDVLTLAVVAVELVENPISQVEQVVQD